MSRAILLTGAGKGLGFSVAQKHLELGDTVFALEYQITDSLALLDQRYSTLTIKQCDLADTTQVNEAMSTLVSAGTPLDIVYNIAGIFFEADRVPLEETDIERCLSLYNVNALGMLRVLANATPLLRKGSVVMNVTSESGSVTDCHRSSEYGYSMSKSACNIASKIFSNQIGDHVRVFCYHPGWLKTDMGGEGARLSSTALSLDEAVDAITDITLKPQNIPADVMYLDYKKNPLNW